MFKFLGNKKNKHLKIEEIAANFNELREDVNLLEEEMRAHCESISEFEKATSPKNALDARQYLEVFRDLQRQIDILTGMLQRENAVITSDRAYKEDLLFRGFQITHERYFKVLEETDKGLQFTHRWVYYLQKEKIGA